MSALKIAQVEAIPVEVPVRRPLRMAVATVHVRTCIVVRITTDDGVTGIGEAVLARYFSGESLASAVDLVDGVFADVMRGRDAAETTEMRDLMARITVHNVGARAAVEMALHDLVAKAHGMPLYELYGGRVRDAVPTIWHVSGGSPEAMAEEAAEAVAEGYPLVKVKVGGDVAHDVAATRAVREAVGPEVMLLPDANQGWDVGDALRYLDGIADTEPAYVEQPLPHWDLQGMARLAGASRIPIAGDEGIFDAHDLRTYLAAGAATAVVAKLMKAAGPIGVREVFAVADAAGIGVHFAGMAGQTSIGAAHAAHLAAAVPHLRYGSGIAPQYLAEDICGDRFLPVAGHLHPADAPGIGVEIDTEALARFRVDR